MPRVSFLQRVVPEMTGDFPAAGKCRRGEDSLSTQRRPAEGRRLRTKEQMEQASREKNWKAVIRSPVVSPEGEGGEEGAPASDKMQP